MYRGAVNEESIEVRADTIGLIMELSHRLADNVCAAAAEHGLTPPQVRAIMTLREPAPMRELAERLACDKSNVTGLVDGLEQRGLVSRRADPTDRRIKQVAFTDAGRHTREALHERLYGRVPALSNLTPDEEEQLRALLRRALGPDRQHGATCGTAS